MEYGHDLGLCERLNTKYGGMMMNKKEKMLRAAVHQHYQCNGKYACEERDYCRFCDGENIAHDCDEDCYADEFSEGFLAGWDACLKYLGEIPWNEAMNEIVGSDKANRSEKLNDSKKNSYGRR